MAIKCMKEKISIDKVLSLMFIYFIQKGKEIKGDLSTKKIIRTC